MSRRQDEGIVEEERRNAYFFKSIDKTFGLAMQCTTQSLLVVVNGEKMHIHLERIVRGQKSLQNHIHFFTLLHIIGPAMAI